MNPALKTVIESTLDMLFPPLCYSCGTYLKKEEKTLNVCNRCRPKIETWRNIFCPTCKRRVPPSPKPRPQCHKQTKFTLAACADYKNPQTRELIHTLKYKKIEKAIHPITELLIKPYVKASLAYSFISLLEKTNQTNKHDESISWIIIPIPLHKSKKRSRGFNQSELIAQELKKYLEIFGNWNLEIDNSLLARTKPTDPQAETKTREEREQNVRNCFSINPKSYALCPKSSVILVDDVYTSGETMKEAVRILKQAGVKRILAFVLAKT